VILLDTNVLSELMRSTPSPRVVSWVAAQAPKSLYVTSIAQAEIFYGVLLLPAGRRRSSVEAAATAMFDTEFAGRVLAFGSDAAPVYAHIAAERRGAGRPISNFDAQTAAIARCTGATLATRNVGDFERCGIKLVDPWEGGTRAPASR
jgi:predicted nucleic acid-binding protein